MAYQVDLSTERFTIVAPSKNTLIRDGGDLMDRMSLPRFDVQGKIPVEGRANSFDALASAPLFTALQ